MEQKIKKFANTSTLLSVIMILSGLAGISYEILYGRLLGNLIGDQFAVSAAILISFLLGLGLGSKFAHKHHKYLWAIELGIGVFGLVFVLSYPYLDKFVYSQSFLNFGGLFAQIIFCCILLLVPAYLIGCSIPLFSSYLRTHRGNEDFSLVYGLYNFGAAVTAMVLEFICVRHFGIKYSVLTFASINLAVALLLYFKFSDIAKSLPEEKMALDHIPKKFSMALVILSIGSAIFQLWMLKMSEFAFGPFRENFALVLTTVLLGLAIGSILVRKWKPEFSTLALINLLFLLIPLALLEPLLTLYATIYEQLETNHGLLVLTKFIILNFMMLVPSITFGASIPALFSVSKKSDSAIGNLLFISSIANSLGFLLMAFAIHRYFNYGTQLFIIIVLSASAGVIYKNFAKQYTLTIGILLAISALLLNMAWDEDLLYLSYTSFQSPKKIRQEKTDFKSVHTFKGYQDIFSIVWSNNTPYFFINGYISFPLKSPSEKIVGLISSLFSPRLDEALVLGLGSGATASAVGQLFQKTDAVEINPVVRENLPLMKEWNFDIANNPKVNIIVDDGIHHVRMTPKKYSLILNTVTTPMYFSSSKLYTDEFFKVIKNKLTGDGIYVTWMDSRIGDDGFAIILETLKQNFAHCGLAYIKTTYFLMLCGEQKLKAQKVDLAKLAPEMNQWFLQEHSYQPSSVVNNLMTTNAFALISENTGIQKNVLDIPVLEFSMAGLLKHGIPLTKTKLKKLLDVQDIKEALSNLEDWQPEDIVVEADRMLGDSFITNRWHKNIISNGGKDAHNRLLLRELKYFSELASHAKTAKSIDRYGTQLMKSQRFPAAIEQFDQVLKLDPEFKGTHYSLATCYEILKQFPKAIEHFRAASKLKPEDFDIQFHLGISYIEAKNFKEGLEILKSRPDFGGIENQFYRAKALAGIGEKEQARELYLAVFNEKDVSQVLKDKIQEELSDLNTKQRKYK